MTWLRLFCDAAKNSTFRLTCNTFLRLRTRPTLPGVVSQTSIVPFRRRRGPVSRDCLGHIPLTSCRSTVTAAVIYMVIVFPILHRATPLSHPASTCLRNSCLSGKTFMFFPPFVLIGPLLRFFIDQHYQRPFTIIDNIQPRRYWWALLQATSIDRFLLGRKGNDWVLFFSSAATPGWFPRPLQWDLWAFRCVC